MTKTNALRRPQNSVHERKQRGCTLCACAMNLARSAHAQYIAHDLHVCLIFCFVLFFLVCCVSKAAPSPETRTEIHHARLHSVSSIYLLFHSGHYFLSKLFCSTFRYFSLIPVTYFLSGSFNMKFTIVFVICGIPTYLCFDL